MTIQSKYPSVLPSLLLDFANSKTIDPRIAFTRGSTATYYDGKTVAKAEENLLIQSQNFSTTWNYGEIVVTGGQLAPDGTNTAIKIAATSLSSQHYMGVLGGVTGQGGNVFSIYVKAAGRTTVRLDGNTSLETADFNLSTGTVSATYGAGVTASITPVGNGWYRIATVGVSLRKFFTLWPDAIQGNYVGNGVDGVLIWGPQCEQRSAVTAYTPTTTQPVTNYIPVLQTAPANVPRIDHDPVTQECRGLLMEASRANLLAYSGQFDNAAWNKESGAVITANQMVSPDGTISADALTSSSDDKGVYQLTPAGNSTTYTASIYVKAGSSTSFRFGMTNQNESATMYYIFNLATVTIGSYSTGGLTFTNNSATITPVGNGWLRLTVVATSPSSGTTSVGIFARNWLAGTVYIWGVQLEVGEFASSYIPTVASQVTRGSDAASISGTNFSRWYNKNEGTIYAEASDLGLGFSTGSPTVRHNVFGLTNGGNSEYCFISGGKTSGGGVYNKLMTGFYDNRVPGAVINANNGSSFDDVVANVPYRFALTYNSTGGRSTSNNSVPDAITGANLNLLPLLLKDINTLNIGARYSAGDNPISGHIRKIAYYPEQLSDTNLSALTSK